MYTTFTFFYFLVYRSLQHVDKVNNSHLNYQQAANIMHWYTRSGRTGWHKPTSSANVWGKNWRYNTYLTQSSL